MLKKKGNRAESHGVVSNDDLSSRRDLNQIGNEHVNKSIGVAVKFIVTISLAVIVMQLGISVVTALSTRDAAATLSRLGAQAFSVHHEASEKLLKEITDQFTQCYAMTLGDIAAHHVLNHEPDHLQLLVDSAAHSNVITTARIVDADGTVLAFSGVPTDSTRIIRQEIIENGLSIGHVELGVDQTVSTKELAFLSSNSKETIASFETTIRGFTRTIMAHIGLVSLAGIIALCLLINMLLKRIVIRPIHDLGVHLGRSSTSVSAAAVQVSNASDSLASGTCTQAASLEETSSSLHEIATLIHDTTDHTGTVRRQADEAREAARSGHHSMGRMSEAITRIKDTSDQTALILKSIDEIAFQTNLLALNAAVEAARAGAAGRGFAVVAEEVRSLAQRSAEASRNTAELINESQASAADGVKMAQELGGQLDAIVGSIERVNEVIEHIDQSSRQQSRGIEQINKAVANIDHVTQANAASAEQSAAASKELECLSEQLGILVNDLMGIVRGSRRARRSPRPPAVSGSVDGGHSRASSSSRAIPAYDGHPYQAASGIDEVISLDQIDLDEIDADNQSHRNDLIRI